MKEYQLTIAAATAAALMAITGGSWLVAVIVVFISRSFEYVINRLIEARDTIQSEQDRIQSMHAEYYYRRRPLADQKTIVELSEAVEMLEAEADQNTARAITDRVVQLHTGAKR